jgi:hypothetical protein
MVHGFKRIANDEIIIAYDISQSNDEFREEFREFLVDDCAGEEQSESVYKISVPSDVSASVVDFSKSLANAIDSKIRRNDKVFIYFLSPAKNDNTNYIWSIEVSK